MSAYLPSDARVVGALVAILIALLLVGYAMAHLRSVPVARASAWTLLVLGTVVVERLCVREEPGVRMIALIASALLVMKAIVAIEERARGLATPSFRRWLWFAAGWPGMRPHLFASAKKGPLPGTGACLREGVRSAALGTVLVFLARVAWTSYHSRLLATVLSLAGLSFVLHFGLCRLLAGIWRLRGIPCDPPFQAPLRSQSLGEFWGRRWNLAFSEMTAIAVYRPLAAHTGRGPAILAGFAFSGLLHEMAISLPVRAGFGLPLLYFLLHGGLVLLERSLARVGHPIDGSIGRAWAFFWLVAPLPWLFHRPFLAGIVWPLIGIPAR